jgi:hypothetical protein
MFREIEPLGGTAGASAVATAPLRHSDGTINFDAYRERARRARTEAIRSSVTEAFSLIGKVFSAGQ